MFEKFFFYIGRGICHQLPDRSIIVQNHQLPICARCTGIYIGIFSSFLFLLILRRWKGNQPPKLFTVLILTLGFIPLIIDGATSYIGLRESNNILRLVTGLLLGIALPIFFTLIKNFDIHRENAKPILKNGMEYLFILGFGALISALIYYELLLPWWLISFTLTCAILMAVLQVFITIIKSIFPQLSPRFIFTLSISLTVVIMIVLSNINKILLSQLI